MVMECPGPWGPCKGTCWDNLTGDSDGKISGLLEKYPTFAREKETGLLGALDT